MIREPAEQRLTRQAVGNIRTLPPPIKGWNTRDRYSESAGYEYAPILTNWVVGDGRIELRAGYETHATGLPGSDVETLMAYAAGTTAKVFAAVGTEIYDVTSAGAVGAAAVTGLANARWQSTMFATTGGQFLVAANGADGVRTYNGSAWATQSISGVAAANLVCPTAHKARLWFIEKNTMDAWYLDSLAIAGTATKFPVGAQCKHGGSLLALGTWTIDGGTGSDDEFILVTDRGEILRYTGTDPASSGTWALAGVYKIDQPLGRHCLVKYGGDLLVLTESGVVQMSQVIQSVAGKDSFSDRIRDQFVSAASGSARTLHGWQLSLYPAKGWLIANIPTNVTGRYRQFIYSALRDAWFPFDAVPAISWLAVNEDLYFGGPSGGVYVADTGTSDDGAEIEGDFQPMWSRYGTSQKKRFTMVRPNILADGMPAPRVAMRTDFDFSPPNKDPIPTLSLAGPEWDEEFWDTAYWAGGLLPSSRWVAVSGMGITGAPRIKISTSTARIALISTDVAFEVGGAL